MKKTFLFWHHFFTNKKLVDVNFTEISMTWKFWGAFSNTFLGNSASLRPAYHGLWKVETSPRKLFGGWTSLGVQRLLALVKFDRSRVVVMKIRANFSILSPLDGNYQLGRHDFFWKDFCLIKKILFLFIPLALINTSAELVSWTNHERGKFTLVYHVWPKIAIYLSRKNDLSDFENHTSWFHLIVQYCGSSINTINFYTCQNYLFHLTFLPTISTLPRRQITGNQPTDDISFSLRILKEISQIRRKTVQLNIVSFVPKKLSLIFDEDFFHNLLYASHYCPIRCSRIAVMTEVDTSTQMWVLYLQPIYNDFLIKLQTTFFKTMSPVLVIGCLRNDWKH